MILALIHSTLPQSQQHKPKQFFPFGAILRQNDHAIGRSLLIAVVLLVAVHPAVGAPDNTSPDDASPKNRGVLPSEKPAGPPPPRPRELLAEVGLGRNTLKKIQQQDNTSGSGNEKRQLFRLLYRLAALPLANLEYWSREAPDVATLQNADDQSLGGTFRLRGRVSRVDRVVMTQEEKTAYGRDTAYRCHLILESAEGPLPCVLYAWDVPAELLDQQPLDAACGANAIFLGKTKADDAPALAFAATRLAWYPDTALGDLQMDVGLLDRIENSKPLRGAEHEAFYQMLAAADRAAAGELSRRAYNQLVHEARVLDKERDALEKKKTSLTETENNRLALIDVQRDYIRKNASHPFVPLVDRPDDAVGELIMLRGTAYRIVKVRIPEADIRKRFGIDHYYQIDMRVNLEHKVKIRKVEKDEATGEEVVDERIVTQYPATFCALRLPPNMPVGDHLLEPIRVAGFYFKNWQYQTATMRDGVAIERAAPMLIGRAPKWDVRQPGALEQWGGIVVGTLFVVVLLGIWGIVWWTGRGDAAFAEKLRASTDESGPLALDEETEYQDTTRFDFQINTSHDPEGGSADSG
ncbi:MAG: hypothetical protein VX431_01930 [Planctomycetota bacterium]|nr:hypothetical protein [Planctomycetota bacterium]